VLFATLLATCFANSIQFVQNVTEEDRAGACDCGVSTKAKRIVGGTPTKVNAYPWVVALIAKVKQSNGATTYAQFCGGSLLNANYIVSAAHCFYDTGVTAAMTMVSLGDDDLSTVSETSSVSRSISTITLHPSYNSKTQNNDISILRMSTPVTFTDNIRPICLPPKTFNPQGKTGTVAGWGTTSENGASSTKLLEVSLPVIPQSTCTAEYGSGITSNMFCAGYAEGKKDSCQGDSGGPFFYKCKSNGRYMQLGIVSFGNGCAKAGFAGVYASIMSLFDFITSNTGGEQLCGSVCTD